MISILFLITPCAWSQNDFQQRVDYQIDVRLNDRNHRLSGTVDITYHNQSPDTLRELYVHLYPNAYSSKQTAYARQEIKLGNKDFAFAGDWELGMIDSLAFAMDGSPVPWMLTADPDIARISLPNPIPPGEKAVLSTPFRVQIPRSFSRLGRVGQSYQVTQWFPKIALYNTEGWHPLPYLDQGEFFSDFGSYSVEITLPENYIVAATGVLQNAEERNHLLALATSKNPPLTDFPQSADAFKTLRFTADNVHDFAWFADKRFAVRRKEINLDGMDIECWSFHTDIDQRLWERAPDYLARSLEFYHKNVGPYPYDQVCAVQAPLSRGTGMEYPMITLIGKEESAFTLDRVIAHEVGHNWFYGMLASNERKFAWMDEGMNSYYEFQYLLRYYNTLGDNALPRFVRDSSIYADPQLYMQFLHRCGRLQNPQSDANDLNSDNYFFGAYYKPALVLWMLKEWVGEAAFNDAMRDYFDKWQFRHPGPADFRKSLEDHFDLDLSWVFDHLLSTSQMIDYAISAGSTGQVKVINRGQVRAPVQLIFHSHPKDRSTTWIDGFAGETIVTLPDDCYRVEIYDPPFSLDATPENNFVNIANGTFRTRSASITMLGRVKDPYSWHVNILPLAGWNDYDKTMIGASISNVQWPTSEWQWTLLPMYATASKSLTGMGEVRKRMITSSPGIEFVDVSASVKSFHYNRDFHYRFRDRYFKGALQLSVRLAPRDQFDTRKTALGYRGIFVNQDYGQGVDFQAFEWEELSRHYFINEFSFRVRHERALTSQRLDVLMHQGKGFLRVTADIRQKFAFRDGNKGFYLHGFAGWLPHLDNPVANVNLYFNGTTSSGFFSKDFTYDQVLFGRNASTGFFSHQVFLRDAGLKTLYNGGLSDSWVLAGGISTDTPLPIPVQPYFDLAVLPDLFEGGTRVSYSGGLSLVIIKDLFEVYFPLVESKDITGSLTYIDRKSVLQRASFVLNLHQLNPHDLINNLLDR